MAQTYPRNASVSSLPSAPQGNDEQPDAPTRAKDQHGLPDEKDIVLGVDEDQAIDGVDPVYAAKARVLNRAIMDIGMGRYQWQLFFCIGYGWSMDNMASV
jgi:hypothetical protein